jgi:proline dehydrogenase
MLRRTLLFLSEREDFKNVLMKMPFSRQAAGRFVAGETSAEALAAARTLNEAGFRVTLDLLGESVNEPEEAEAATAAYRMSLLEIDESDAVSTISLKLTQLGLDIDEEFCFRNILGIVHLRRSEADIRERVRVGAPVRLCKGAYQEPASVAFQLKTEVDASFIRLMHLLLDGGSSTAIASHDERMINATLEHVARNGIPDDTFELQMLYGVRRDYQRQLVANGLNMRIYVPYGSQWYSYLMRRMAERPANLLFGLRAALGG